MTRGKLVYAQIMEHVPLTTFRRCVARYGGEHKVKTFSCLDQYLPMAFAHLAYRENLRDIEACLGAHASKPYHTGIRISIARNTLANANAVRDWRVYADLAQSFIGIARPLYAKEPFGVDLKDAVYALDASTNADLYRCRWQVELFFKWIKLHLRIKVFFGTSENAVKTQIWIAV